ncbi:hypothetical protein [Clostridioides difficile]|uniref:hypothetical protein n=1 Tax=Clostridioides difficile TaxID=1496 RepID=UPI00370AD097
MKIWKYNRTVKKRRGVYAELDILAQRYEFEADGKLYRAFFHLYTNKNIDIFRDKDLYKESYMMDYKIENVITDIDDVVQQTTTVRFIPDPVIDIVIDNISRGCEINYKIIDNEPSVKFIVTEKLNGTIIETKTNSSDNNYKLKLTDKQIVPLALNSSNSIVIEISTEDGGLVTSKTVTFTRTNNKPTILVNSYSSNSAKFIVSDLDNNLSKIEWYLDDVLKETITTDLTTEKTINYELADNAIHTLKIVATDAENATVEKVLSISKEIMPLQEDASLSDISTKLIEIGEGFKNGKTSIINTLALKNIEASLNNTLIELSEKIKISFDSSDASVQELQNRITELNNQLSQRIKYATGTYTIPDGSKNALIVPTNLTFVPKTIAVKIIPVKDGSNPYKYLSAYPCMTNVNQNLRYDNGSYTRVIGSASIRDVTADSFKIELGKSDFNAGVEFPFTFYNSTFRWHALDIELLNN